MALRCHISDFDISSELCDDLGRALWDNVGMWPVSGVGTDGVIAEVTKLTDTTEGVYTLTSATGNFNHARPGTTQTEPVKVATLVNIIGYGFCKVTEVVSSKQLKITTEMNRASMAVELVAGTYNFVVGGYTAQIQRAFDRLSGKIDGNAVDDDFRGADLALMWGALELILFRAYRNNDSSYKDKYDEAKAQRIICEGELSFGEVNITQTTEWGRA